MANFLKNKVVPALKWFASSFIWVFIIMLTLDIVTKNLIMQNMTVGQSAVLIPGFLRITYVQNFNAAFGQGVGNPTASRIVFCVVAGIASIVITVMFIWKFKKIKPFIKGCLMLILTGAVGNIIDRLFYGPDYAVVDFIDFYGIWGYVFNIADCGVVIGAIILIIVLVIQEVKDWRIRNAQENEEYEREKARKSIDENSK